MLQTSCGKLFCAMAARPLFHNSTSSGVTLLCVTRYVAATTLLLRQGLLRTRARVSTTKSPPAACRHYSEGLQCACVCVCDGAAKKSFQILGGSIQRVGGRLVYGLCSTRTAGTTCALRARTSLQPDVAVTQNSSTSISLSLSFSPFSISLCAADFTGSMNRSIGKFGGIGRSDPFCSSAVQVDCNWLVLLLRGALPTGSYVPAPYPLPV